MQWLNVSGCCSCSIRISDVQEDWLGNCDLEITSRGSDSTEGQMKGKSLYNTSHHLSIASNTEVVLPSEDNICSVNREISRDI
jgi:hypothetical protein